MKSVALCICAVVGYFLLLASPDLPNWGDPNSPASTHVSPYYIQHSMEETSVPNFVTSVLADYRGYDTMFETSVIFCAGLTVLSILRRSHRNQERVIVPRPARKNADIILQEASRLLLPPMQLFALYVIAHGHHSPGGGFQGGVILGASLILLAIGLFWAVSARRPSFCSAGSEYPFMPGSAPFACSGAVISWPMLHGARFCRLPRRRPTPTACWGWKSAWPSPSWPSCCRCIWTLPQMAKWTKACRAGRLS